MSRYPCSGPSKVREPIRTTFRTPYLAASKAAHCIARARPSSRRRRTLASCSAIFRCQKHLYRRISSASICAHIVRVPLSIRLQPIHYRLWLLTPERSSKPRKKGKVRSRHTVGCRVQAHRPGGGSGHPLHLPQHIHQRWTHYPSQRTSALAPSLRFCHPAVEYDSLPHDLI